MALPQGGAPQRHTGRSAEKFQGFLIVLQGALGARNVLQQVQRLSLRICQEGCVGMIRVRGVFQTPNQRHQFTGRAVTKCLFVDCPQRRHVGAEAGRISAIWLKTWIV